MLILWSILVSSAVAHKVVDSNEDVGPEAFSNVTTLFLVATPTPNTADNDTTKSKSEATVWKIEATYGESGAEKEIGETGKQSLGETGAEKQNIGSLHNLEQSVQNFGGTSPSGMGIQHFGETGSEKESFSDKEKAKVPDDFKPSPHLGSIVEVLPTRSSFESYAPVVRKPAAGFVSPTKDYRSPYYIPPQLQHTHTAYPYKFENSISSPKDPWPQDRPTGYWHPGLDSLETKPTAEVPVRIPAGGMYSYQEPFREPGSELTAVAHDGFGPEFGEGHKENSLKKRGSPWEDILRMLTAFIPVGIIISALTPSIITLENTGVDNGYSSNVFRRSDAAALPVISERCRRRLLCELRSDTNYTPYEHPPPARRRQCHKLRCEDEEALATTLKWLREYRGTHHNH